MTTLLFADTHNLVAFLDKPAESEGFEQIVDFLNASSIRYALTVNPTIYTSCIQQFWATTKVKTVNGEVQLQALVDGKKVIITEISVRRDLQLEDAEGIACLPNANIFEQLALMGYEKPSQKLTFYKAFFSPQWKFFIHTILQCLSAKSTAWNEFSSTMASVIICLDTNQKFNFSKYIFESMVKNVDSSVKFLMYPRFVQVFLNQQADDMSNHKRIYVTPSYTKKVFGNIKRGGKGFSGRVTPLFPAMMVQAQQEIELIADAAANEENVPTHSNNPLLSGEDRLKLKELMTLCTNLQNRVLDLEHIKTTHALEIKSLKRRVNKLEKKQRSRTPKLKRLFKVGKTAQVVSSEDEGRYDDAQMFDTDVFNGEEVIAEQDVVEKEVSTVDPVTTAGEVVTTASVEVTEEEEQARLAREKAEEVKEANISWDNVQAMIEADRLLAERLQAREEEELTDKEKARLFVELLEKKKKHVAALRAQEKRNKPPTKAQKKSTMSTYLKHMAGYKQSQLKNKLFVEIQKLFDKAMTRVNMFVDKDTELVKESSKKAEVEMAQESSSKRAGEELEQEVAKTQKMEEDKEKEDLKQCFKIVQDDEVAIDAIPLATKPAPIINFQIHRKGRNGYYEIIRADESAKTYLLFSQLLKEFDKEDLENL
ncbi:hypothetical protein Tco_1395042 [Tanacetum coccineum]